MRQVHLALPEGGARVGAVRDPAGRPGQADGHREEKDLRHCQRPGGGPDDDQGIKAEDMVTFLLIPEVSLRDKRLSL